MRTKIFFEKIWQFGRLSHWEGERTFAAINSRGKLSRTLSTKMAKRKKAKKKKRV